LKSVIYILAFLFVSQGVLASGNGVISKLVVGRLGYQVFVKINGTVDQVACRTRTDWDYYLDLTNAGAKEILSALLAAKASKQNVWIQSTGACDSTGQGLEILSYVILN